MSDFEKIKKIVYDQDLNQLEQVLTRINLNQQYDELGCVILNFFKNLGSFYSF